MNRIAQYLRDAGYKGALTDADAVRAFLSARPEVVEFQGADGKAIPLDEVVKIAAKKVVIGLGAVADAGEEVEFLPPQMDGGSDSGDMPADGEASAEQRSAKRPETKQRRSVESIVARTAGAGASALAQKKAAYKSRRDRFGVGGGTHQVAFDDYDTAEAFGAFARSAIFGARNYAQKNADLDIVQKTQVTNVFTASGALVPDEFQASLIEIVLDYGVARQVAGVTSMSRDVVTVPRLTGDVTSYWTAEAAAITASDPDVDQVQLVAQKLATLSKVSSELMNDSAINVSAMLAQSIARGRASKEDQAFFNGTGTSTYGSNFGVIGKLNSIGTNPEDAAGLSLAAGDEWADITQQDIDDMFGLLYSWSGIQNPVIVCHSKFYWTVLVKFLNRYEAANVNAGRGPADRPAQSFYGYPVVFSNVMPSASTANSSRDTVPMLFGDFRLGAKFGEVSGSMEIATSSDSDFANDLIAIRSTGRVAINVHDVGDGTTPGPIVGLIMEDA